MRKPGSGAMAFVVSLGVLTATLSMVVGLFGDYATDHLETGAAVVITTTAILTIGLLIGGQYLKRLSAERSKIAIIFSTFIALGFMAQPGAGIIVATTAYLGPVLGAIGVGLLIATPVQTLTPKRARTRS